MIPPDAPHMTVQYLPMATSALGVLVVIGVIWFFVLQFKHMDNDD